MNMLLKKILCALLPDPTPESDDSTESADSLLFPSIISVVLSSTNYHICNNDLDDYYYRAKDYYGGPYKTPH
ncbi:Uncharacterised protein [Salmonella enterica subsp. enterica serovar Typhi]|nr:Uncharacterised protein [Salmonella enterica subsp. enterica serovar Typhi]